MAQEDGLDLIEVSRGDGTSVCKLADYGKYKYDKDRLQKENKKKQKVVSLKEIKVKPNIGANDLDIKKKKIIQFIGEGKKVKLLLVLRGRQRLYASRGEEVLNKICEDLADIATFEKSFSGQRQVMMTPKVVQKDKETPKK